MIKIKKIGVFSLAKIQGVTMAIFGLLAGIFIALPGALLGAASSGKLAFGAGFGIASVIIIPIIYGIMGFIAGALGAFIFNVVVKMVGGLEVELDSPNELQ